VIEAREQRDATIQEALEKVEAMKKDCDGILSSFLMSFVFKFCLSLTYFLLPSLALCVEKQKLLKNIEDMKVLVQSNHSRVEEVIIQAKEDLALAKLIQRGADRDLV
jgi:hypothetical protein